MITETVAKLQRLLRPDCARLVHPIQVVPDAAIRIVERLLCTAGYSALPDGYWTQTQRTASWLEGIATGGRRLDEPTTKLLDVAVVTEVVHPYQLIPAAAMSAAVRTLINAGCVPRPDGYWTPTAQSAVWLDDTADHLHEAP